MSFYKSVHLSEDQLITAVVGEGDLSPSSREHLTACPRCRDEKVQLARDLVQIGRWAEHYAPSSKQKVLIPASEYRSVFPWPRHCKAVFGMVLSAMLLVVFVWWLGNLGITPENGLEMAAYENLEAERLMIEVNMLTENALPAVYMEITGESHVEESYTDFDEEFMQFVIPSINEGPVSGPGSASKGVMLC